MKRKELLDKTKAMRAGTMDLYRTGEYWVEEELELMQKQFYAGTAVNEIALELERSEEEVYQMIQSRGLFPAPIKHCRRFMTSFGGYVRFPGAMIHDPGPRLPSSSSYFANHIEVGNADV